MAIPEAIDPKVPMRVIDMVRDAGIDVSDWGNYAKGADQAASNPRYCYEWAFVEPGKVVALNLWYDKLVEHEGFVEQHLNLLADARREPKGARAKRRMTMLRAIETALTDRLPVRVVVLRGQPSKPTKAGRKGRAVDLRVLDPVPWAVVSIGPAGDIVLRRGVPAAPLVDQFDIADVDEEGVPTRKSVTGSVFERSPEVRRKVLLRALGVCELCKSPGFKVPGGGLYLETHHVVPLHKGGPDRVSNVVALCPNDHREAHHGERSAAIREALLEYLATKSDA
jgi:5-methylcytosine-specific restriction protein A